MLPSLGDKNSTFPDRSQVVAALARFLRCNNFVILSHLKKIPSVLDVIIIIFFFEAEILKLVVTVIYSTYNCVHAKVTAKTSI